MTTDRDRVCWWEAPLGAQALVALGGDVPHGGSERDQQPLAQVHCVVGPELVCAAQLLDLRRVREVDRAEKRAGQGREEEEEEEGRAGT